MGIFKQLVDGYKEAKAAREHAEAGIPYTPKTNPKPNPIASYTVIYKGGLPDYRQEKSSGIDMELFKDRIEFLPTIGSNAWFNKLIIPIATITDVQIVERTISTVEGILGGLDSRQLNQANNINIAFRSATGANLILRVEMISGVTVMGQAGKCREFMDRLRAYGLIDLFQPANPKIEQTNTSSDIPTQIEKLAALRDKGILSTEEFNAKKIELLARM